MTFNLKMCLVLFLSCFLVVARHFLLTPMLQNQLKIFISYEVLMLHMFANSVLPIQNTTFAQHVIIHTLTFIFFVGTTCRQFSFVQCICNISKIYWQCVIHQFCIVLYLFQVEGEKVFCKFFSHLSEKKIIQTPLSVSQIYFSQNTYHTVTIAYNL